MRNPFLGTSVVMLGGTGPVARLIRRQLAERHPASIESPSRQKIRLPGGVDKLPLDCDVVINFAALSRPGPTNSQPQEALDTNVVTVQKLLAHYHHTRTHIVCVSSVKTTVIQSMYGWSKLAAEALVASASDDVQATIIRLGNIIETAPSIMSMIRSIQDIPITGGFIASSSEYYQPADTVLDSISVAIESSPGSIVTPLLPAVPLPFIAGYLAGLFQRSQEISLRSWAPEYVYGDPTPPLIPDWWLPYTSVIERASAACEDGSSYYLVTNFKARPDAKSAVENIRDTIAIHGKTRLGAFATKLSQILRRVNSDAMQTT
jgi:hypothetical protein